MGDKNMMSLEEARAEVDGWLDEVKLTTGKCSGLLRHELAEHMRHRTQSVFAIYGEIGQMEQSDPPRRTGTKPPKRIKGELKGLKHKHYKVSSLSSFALNQLNHWERKQNQAKLTEIIEEFCHDDHAGKLAHELVLGAHTGRHAADEITGEWIVYAEVGGVNYYLTLATHKEPDSAVRERVRVCFVEFPVLQAQLGW
jgi:hypothetical protein